MPKLPRSIDAIVEQQVLRWEAARAKERRPVQRIWPVVTVSRSFGSQGAALAAAIADRTGFELWNQEIVHAVAESAHLPERLLASLDEHRRNAVLTVLDAFGAPTGGEESYFRHLLAFLHTLGEHGSAVIVGRGAHFALEADATLRVRVDAPVAHRVASLAARRGIDEREARKLVEEADAERRDFMRQYYDRQLDDASAFDLVLNSATLTPDGMVDVVLSAYRARFGAIPEVRAHKELRFPG